MLHISCIACIPVVLSCIGNSSVLCFWYDDHTVKYTVSQTHQLHLQIHFYPISTDCKIKWHKYNQLLPNYRSLSLNSLFMYSWYQLLYRKLWGKLAGKYCKNVKMIVFVGLVSTVLLRRLKPVTVSVCKAPSTLVTAAALVRLSLLEWQLCNYNNSKDVPLEILIDAWNNRSLIWVDVSPKQGSYFLQVTTMGTIPTIFYHL